MDEITVEVDWVGRRVADLPQRTRGRMGRRRRRQREGERGHRWIDALDVPFDADSILVGLAVVAVVVLSVVLWELFVGAIVLFFLELVVLVPLTLAALVWRTLLGHPWRVVVRLGEQGLRTWDARTWFAARRLVRDLRAQLAAGATPDQLHATGALPPD